MRYPKMVIFDVGNTLLYKEFHDSQIGIKQIFYCLQKDIQEDELSSISNLHDDMLNKIKRMSKSCGIDIKYKDFIKMFIDYCNIECKLEQGKMEEIFWDNARRKVPYPNTYLLLKKLLNKKIRIAVICNSILSSDYMKKLLGKIFPEINFEFILCSCEYVCRKPSPILFEIAVKKARLEANQIWYCGDTIEKDVIGAANTGIFPVLYEYKENSLTSASKGEIHKNEGLDYLSINNWMQLINILDDNL